MLSISGRAGLTNFKRTETGGTNISRGLEWLWQHLKDTSFPHILDCGPVRQSTAGVFLRRGAKLYLVDLISPALHGDARFWDRSRKTPLFQIDDFLAQLPPIPPGSLSAIFCWQLLDLLPRDSLAALVLHLYLYLQPAGVVFCILREPYLPTGAEPVWWLESLTGLRRDSDGHKPFPYPALTNRGMERLIPTGSVKTFLTRSGLREVLAVK